VVEERQHAAEGVQWGAQLVRRYDGGGQLRSRTAGPAGIDCIAADVSLDVDYEEDRPLPVAYRYSAGEELVGLERDEAGRLKQLVRDYSGTPSPPRSAAQALLTIYDREDHTEGDPPSTRPRLAISDHRLAAGGPVAQLSGFEYVFRPDELAQRVQRTRWRPGPGVSTDYGCNPRGWLTSADADDDGYDEAYGYDGSAEGWDGPGNLAGYDAEKRAYTAAGNRLAEDDEHAYAHDARGNVVRRVWLGDPPWGEPKTRKLVYDAQGHLVELRDEGGDSAAAGDLRVRRARPAHGPDGDPGLLRRRGGGAPPLRPRRLEVDPDLLGTPGQCDELAGVLNRRAYGPGIDGCSGSTTRPGQTSSGPTRSGTSWAACGGWWTRAGRRPRRRGSTTPGGSRAGSRGRTSGR